MYLGGLVGYCTSGFMGSHCYSTGAVNGNILPRRIPGYNQGGIVKLPIGKRCRHWTSLLEDLWDLTETAASATAIRRALLQAPRNLETL